MQSQVEAKFSTYYEKWLTALQTHLHQLLSVSRHPSNEQEQQKLVFKVFNLYKEYYKLKWIGAREDVLGFFSSPWLTPSEKALEWMTGWKPSSAYKLLDSFKGLEVLPLGSLSSLSEKQLMMIEMLRVKTSMEEQKVEREMERQQMSVADRRSRAIAKMSGCNGKEEMEMEMEMDIVEIMRSEGEDVKRIVDGAVDSLVGGLENVMKAADCVRLKTLKGVLDVLTPVQRVDYMAGLVMVQIQLRKLGKRREIIRDILVPQVN